MLGQTRRNPLSVPGRPDYARGATRGHAGWREALRKILGGYRENGNGICSASDDVFGPDRNFENPWLLPVSGTNNQRCVNHISEPDNEIPPGFRG